MTGATLINGQWDERIDAADRGLQYGDGLFETIAVVDGRAPYWPAHYARLCRGGERLGLAVPPEALLLEELGRLVTGTTREVVKLILTRGVGGRGYRPPEPATPTRILSRHPWPDYPPALWQAGIAATRCRVPLARNPHLAGIKHLNRLEQVLARAEWGDAYQEGVMCDTRGNVVSGTMSNLFLVTETGLLTPELTACGIEGTTRARVIAVAGELGIPVTTGRVSLADLEAASGLFFCNAVIGIWPVQHLDGAGYRIDEMTRKLMRSISHTRESA